MGNGVPELLADSALDFLAGAAMETGLGASAGPVPRPLLLLPLLPPSVPPAPSLLFLGSPGGVGGAARTLGRQPALR